MFLRPRSLLHLTVIAFLTVSAPLIVALVINARQLDTLGDNSQRAVSRAADAMRASRALIEQTLAMERNARQYAVLGDRRLLDIYADRRKDFTRAADRLHQLAIDDEVDRFTVRLVDGERQALELLQDARAGQAATDVAASLYPPLTDLANQIAGAISRWIDRELLDLGRQVGQTQRLIWIEALLLAGTALLLAGVFTALITRPLGQIDRAIRQLGDTGLDSPVSISGPLDLQELGERLEWLRNRLAGLEQQRTTFLRHVSHELKTPLTAIQEGAALLSDGLVGPLTGQQAEIFAILRKKCRQLQQMIEDLLRFNVNLPAMSSPAPRAVAFSATINRVVSDHALAIKAGRIRVASRLEDVSVYGDPEQLRVVVDNLLANAIRYSPPAGTIDIRLERDGESAVLEICDEGPGIPAGERHLVFEAFYQGRPPADRHGQGSGLGLAITLNYVKLNGGEIRILEAARGARFRVSIPVEGQEES